MERAGGFVDRAQLCTEGAVLGRVVAFERLHLPLHPGERRGERGQCLGGLLVFTERCFEVDHPLAQ